MFLSFGAVRAQEQWPHVVPSKDGIPISYEIYGAGEPSLVFVHGWSCDARYWRAQLSHFSKNHRVVVLDLAGHGHSGSSRSKYTMKAFGEDVRAVTEATNSQSVILIGHSMGGSVIDENEFDRGIADLYRTAEADGDFCYTFFKAVGINTSNAENAVPE